MIKPISFGISECCKSEADEGDLILETDLYKSRNGNLLCGGCMADFEGDAECHEMAYGSD